MSAVPPSPSTVRAFFASKTVFITGATGFLGQALLHKLLSLGDDARPDAIYVLVRHKRGVDSKDRIVKLLQADIFKPLWEQLGEKTLVDTVRAVTGDITKEGLGLSDTDRTMLRKEVEVVFHSAATVRFDEQLTKSVLMNMEATSEMMRLAKTMTKLVSFVHVSTAYSQCHMSHDEPIEEHVYPVNGVACPRELIDLCKDESMAKKLDTVEETKRLVGDRPNTYTFTKALAEQLVSKEGKGLPISIVRPSIVIAANEEPAPGWINNFNGPTGLVAGAGTGLLRTYHCSRSLIADLVPVDFVINLMCTVAAHPPQKHDPLPLYNCTSGLQNPITWEQIELWMLGFIRKHPMQDMFWYPGGSFKEWFWLDQLCQILFHFAPAYIVDTALRLIGRKPFFVPIYTKMSKAMGALQFFATRQWIWRDTNSRALWASLDTADRQKFPFDMTALQWQPFLERYVLGTRRYVLKSSPDTLPKARRKLAALKLLHWAVQTLLFGVTVGLMYYVKCWLQF